MSGHHGTGKLLVTDTELSYGLETQGRDKTLLSQIGSVEDQALSGCVGTCQLGFGSFF